MKNKKTWKLVMAGLLAAMTCVATMIIKIPTVTGGYVNLGDCIVLLSGLLLGPLYGGAAAGIGSALADLLSGYLVYVPITFIIKFFMAFIIGFFVANRAKKSLVRTAIFAALAECVMVGGYFFFEATFMGYGMVAAGSIPGNLVQGVAGMVLFLVLSVAKWKKANGNE